MQENLPLERRKPTSRLIRAWAAGLLGSASLISSSAFAADREVTPFTPTSDTIVISGNDNLIQGSGKGFAELLGNDIGFRNISVKDAFEQGILTKGTEFVNAFNVQQGGLSDTTTVIDPVTGNKRTINVFDNDDMFTTSLADFTFANHYDVGPEGQYVDKFIYDISSDSTLNVDVGDKSSEWVNNPANFVNIIMKSSGTESKFTSAVYKVEDGGTLNYNGKTIVSLGNIASIGSTTPRSVAGFQVPVGGTIDSKIGSFTINNLDDIKAYNTALIKALQENRLSPADYESEFYKALTPGSIEAIDSVSAGDPVVQTINKNRVAYIYATGPGAKVNIADGANIQTFRSDASLVRVENGAQLTNSGDIGAFYSNITSGGYVISADNSSVHNMATGVIDAGTNQEVGAFNYNGQNMANLVQVGRITAITARDSDIINDGVINVTSPQSYAQQLGIQALGDSNVTNNGAINVASNTQTSSVLGNGVANIGVSLAGRGSDDRSVSMVNNGTISIGRSAQRNLTDVSEDVAVDWVGVTGVAVTNANFTNNGDITTGALTHGVTAIKSVGGTVNQAGTITINSAYSPEGKVPAQSIAMDVWVFSQAENSGTITLNGVNGVGMNVRERAEATNSGTIVVAQGIDGQSKTPNYGIVSQGKGAKATLTGNVDLTGDGAIGVYVKEGGVAAVDGGNVNFVSGVNQTGYVIHGADSSITNSHSVQSVSTDGSTLYRHFRRGRLCRGWRRSDASGAGSTILLATGRNDENTVASNINTAGMTLRVNGQDATALRVEGGAEATIDASTNISLAQNGATAGIVRGGSTTITGEEGATGASVLNSAAVLNGDNVAVGALGYKVLTGGTLNHSGTIDLAAADSTGVLINGGTLNNTSSISVNGTAVDIIGANSTVNNTGVITATDGRAAFRLSDGASLNLTGSGVTHATGSAHGILLDDGATGLTVKDATINMDPISTGNGIENKAEIAGIHLDNTTINAHNGAGVRTSASLAQSNSGVINVIGSGTGLLFQNADGSMTDNAYDMSQSQALVVNVNSAEGRGMTTNTSGDIKTGVSVNVNDASGSSALVIGGQTAHVEQSGMLASTSATQVVDINNGHTTDFVNSGTIASTAADALVMNVDKQAVHFTNQANGNLTGAVNLLSGNNTVTLEHGSQAKTAFTTARAMTCSN